jgi:prepilin-type N-terminal cleavage/methylation domain-containing protein
MKNYRASKRQTSAYTLIELLVVIAIIAILAAILFPVFVQARIAAQQTQSLSSVKQIGPANIMYPDTYDQQGPYWVYLNRADDPRRVNIQEGLNPFMKSTDIWMNPAGSRNVASYVTDPSSVCRTNPTRVVSHYVMVLWNPFTYYDWAGTIMMAGWPTPPQPPASATGQAGRACAPDDFVLQPPYLRYCVGMMQVDEPSSTVIVAPGAQIGYNRPPPAPDQELAFGTYCVATWRICPANATNWPGCVGTGFQDTTRGTFVFRDGMNFGMADTSAKWFSAHNMNRNNSQTHRAPNGAILPASPFMSVRS